MKPPKPFAASTDKENIDWQFIANLTIWLVWLRTAFPEKLAVVFQARTAGLARIFDQLPQPSERWPECAIALFVCLPKSEDKSIHILRRLYDNFFARATASGRAVLSR